MKNCITDTSSSRIIINSLAPLVKSSLSSEEIILKRDKRALKGKAAGVLTNLEVQPYPGPQQTVSQQRGPSAG